MKHYQNPMVSERRKEQVMGWTWTWVPNQRQRLRRWKKTRVLFAAFLCCISFFLFTPKIPRSLNHHRFADLRNLLGNCSLTHSLSEISIFLVFDDLSFWVLHRSAQHFECDHKFPIFGCGCSWPCSRSGRRCFQHKVTSHDSPML